MEEQKHPITLTKIKLSKEAIDTLVLSSLDVHYINKSDFVEYITSSGQKIMLPHRYISVRKR